MNQVRRVLAGKPLAILGRDDHAPHVVRLVDDFTHQGSLDCGTIYDQPAPLYLNRIAGQTDDTVDHHDVAVGMLENHNSAALRLCGVGNDDDAISHK